MSAIKPSSAPLCWGQKYQDGDKECDQCMYADTCKSAMFLKLSGSSNSRPSLPVLSSAAYPAPPKPPVQPPAPFNQPLYHNIPARTYSSSSQVPIAKTYSSSSTPTYQTSQPSQPTYQTNNNTPQYSNSNYSIPDPSKPPHPMNYMHRPGASGPGYFPVQYPNESIGERLTKNLLLRGLEAIFNELAQFFRHWTWPS